MKTFATVAGSSRLFAAVVAGVVMGFSSTLTQAQPITGSLSFTGGADVTGGTNGLSTATAYTGFFGSGSGGKPVVLGGSQIGSYATVPTGTAVTFFPFTFLPFNSPQELWTFSVGPTIYSFTATTLTDLFPGTPVLNLQGTGTLAITGFANTSATWTYTDIGNGPGTAFNFGASITATPEPSTASLMVVLALVGVVVRIVTKRKTGLQACVS
jgi:hypothetical protein